MTGESDRAHLAIANANPKKKKAFGFQKTGDTVFLCGHQGRLKVLEKLSKFNQNKD